MKKNTFSYQFNVRNSRTDKRGEAPIELSITINGKRVVIQLPYRTKPETFKQKRQPQEIVDYLDAQRVKIKQIITEMAQMGITLTAPAFRDYFREGGVKAYTIGNLVDDYLALKKSSKVSQQLYHKYEFVANILTAIIPRDKECSQITNAHIRKFAAIVEEKYKNSTAISYLTKLRSFIHFAIDNGKLPVNPLQNVKIVKKPNKIDYLTEEEIELLRNVELDTESLRRIRDCAIWQISSGLSYCDCLELQPTDLKEQDGVYYISKNRHKTGTPFFAVVLPMGVDVYNKYNGRIPFISNQKYNLFLKVLGERAGIKKNLHTHLFRHSYCSLLLNRSVPIKVVSRCAGHSSVRMTESFYSVLEDRTILKEVGKVI